MNEGKAFLSGRAGYFSWLSVGLFAAAVAMMFTSYREKETIVVIGADGQEVDAAILPQVIRSVNLDRTFDFAGEVLPMDNPDVRQRLDRELLVNSYWHSNTLLCIKKAHQYFPVMEPILAQNGIPDDFKYLAVAESNLTNVSSPAGAKGFWQFMKPTGEGYGLEINSEVDERYHVEKATQAFCKYIQGYKDKFGDWLMAAAAYNMGGPRFEREVSAQRADNYFDLNLNAETDRYVFRLTALKEIIARPRDFGFYLEQDDLYPPMDNFKLVEINGPVANFGDFAKEQGISYRQLKLYNPWLLDNKLINAKRKTYQIKIPN